eukprot:1970741-Rhodomonas_salina.5
MLTSFAFGSLVLTVGLLVSGGGRVPCAVFRCQGSACEPCRLPLRSILAVRYWPRVCLSARAPQRSMLLKRSHFQFAYLHTAVNCLGSYGDACTAKCAVLTSSVRMPGGSVQERCRLACA